MSEPEDRDLRDYLDGNSPLSKAYRQASQDRAPAHLDEAILAQAKGALRRKPSWNRTLAPFALAASVLLGVNLAWNVYEVAPPPQADGAAPRVTLERLAEAQRARRAAEKASPKTSVAAPAEQQTAAAPSPVPSPAPDREAAMAPAESAALAPAEPAPRAARSKRAEMPVAAQADSGNRSALESSRDAVSPDATIEDLLVHVEGLQGVVVLPDGQVVDPPDAARRLRADWQGAGADVHTPDDFINCCVNAARDSGQAYRLRAPDGRERPLAEVLRDWLRLR